jgi:hypothetical protein
MHSKLRALQEARISKMRQDVDLDEIEYNLANGKLNQFERRRELIKKEELLSHTNWTNKLINDAICELNILYNHFNKLPKFTREQFEAGEQIHFEQKLSRAVLGMDGAKESLVNMKEDILAISQYENAVASLENATTEQLIQLTNQMPNMLKEKL